MGQSPGTASWNVAEAPKNVFWAAQLIFAKYEWMTLDFRISHALKVIQVIYYPGHAIIALPVHLVTILILSRGKCGLSRVVTRYLVAMAAADLMVVVLDLILNKIPNIYAPIELLIWAADTPVCQIHAVLLYAATDCSVWFTVTFTFDRFVAICCQKLKTKYCTGRTAAVMLGTVTAISCLRNIYWYFRFSGYYAALIAPFICVDTAGYVSLFVGMSIDLFNYLLTPVIPFLLVLLTNALTIRHVLVTSRGRRRLRRADKGQSARDPEMESRRKSLVLLLIISGNFVLLWAPFTVYSAWNRLSATSAVTLPADSLRGLGSMLQILSCCTNTALYAVTQTKFREQLKDAIKYPLALIAARMS
ncbi:probable G-protein coupled receptor 139 [Mobula hypostoma]|uniref:probable G-protein coupled receptor 139 n=1 Tax=Mobula hypostoma TaxID=723540 RepID=UPI002FC37836